MPHTKSRYQMDMGFSDGVIILSPLDAIQTGGASTLTRNAAGDLSNNAGASVSPIYSFCLGDGQLFRTGFGEDLQEQFGGTGIAASAEYQGRPDALASMNTGQQITPRTAMKIKGIKINSVAVIYLITGAALTGHTCRADKTVFSNNVANAITSLLASGTNGLQTATQANPYVTEVPLTTQVYNVADLSQIWFEVAPTTQVAGAYRMYGVRAKVEFNFN